MPRMTALWSCATRPLAGGDEQKEVWTLRWVMQLAVLPFYPPYHAVLAVKGGACGRALAAFGHLATPDCLRCGVLRRSRAIPPDQIRSTTMSQFTRSSETS